MKRYSRQLHLEPLEERQLLSTCHVTRLSDAGAGFGFRGDLRYCINKVNTVPGPDSIDFKVTGTIQLTGALPDLSTDTDIVGPGAADLIVRRNTGGDYRIFSVALGTTVRIAGVTIANGLVKNDIGGGIHNFGTLTLEAANVTDNHASGSNAKGGGIYNQGILTVFRSDISANSCIDDAIASGFISAQGGGIYNSGNLTISESTLSENRVYAAGYVNGIGFGGAIFTAHPKTSSFAIIRSTIANNAAEGYGHGPNGSGAGWVAGVYAGGNGGGLLTIVDSDISHNQAIGRSNFGNSGSAVGGGVFVGIHSALYLANSTVAANSLHFTASANDKHSGIALYGLTSTIQNSTIAANNGGGGIGIENGCPLTLRNSIVANNGSSGDLFGKLQSSSFNLIGNSTGGSGFAPSDILNADPLLGPLAPNGGPTLTMALLPGSPAIDSGDNTDAPEWDQRGPGYPRIVNGTIDIGAFEVQATGAPSAHFLAVLVTAYLNNEDTLL